MDKYSTHIPALAAVAMHTQGPIVEFGCGDYSTPLLHEICRPQQRRLLSLETDKAWASRFLDLRTPWHEILVGNSYEDFDQIVRQPLDVAFIDHAPTERRVVDIAKLRPHAMIIVVHDADCRIYGYESILPLFRHRVRYGRMHPRTDVVSEAHLLDFMSKV